jgi:small subunit ribosomal protein S4
MGDPRKPKKKYSRPSHPWQKARIEEEKALIQEYGLKNKKEIWKVRSQQKKVANQAKVLILETGDQGIKLQKQLISRLHSLGVVSADARLDDVLSLTIKSFLERRLQTILVRKGLSDSLKQARQMITHGHIKVGNKVMTVPSYLVLSKEENEVTFNEKSPFADEEHPERKQPETVGVPIEEDKKESKKDPNKETPKKAAESAPPKAREEKKEHTVKEDKKEE